MIINLTDHKEKSEIPDLTTFILDDERLSHLCASCVIETDQSKRLKSIISLIGYTRAAAHLEYSHEIERRIGERCNDYKHS